MVNSFGRLFLVMVLLVVVCTCCSTGNSTQQKPGGTPMIKILTLDPAHFHAALVQKEMYPEVDTVVHVYAPEGQDLESHLKLVNQYNTRAENPTRWHEEVYRGTDFMERMINEKKGNVVVLAGNNLRKTEFIKQSVDAGFHVLADKPMAIDSNDFALLLTSFDNADEKNSILYDIMTERSEITNILQQELSRDTGLFGQLEKGTATDPAVIIESVHHFSKTVSGNPLIRPEWFFDPAQQGEPIADVGVHLVDLVQWVCFPGQTINYKTDIKLQSAKLWPTPLSLSQYKRITNKEFSRPAEE